GSSRTGGTPTPSSRFAVSSDRSSVASPASTTAVSWPTSTEPFTARCRGTEARVASVAPAVTKYSVFMAYSSGVMATGEDNSGGSATHSCADVAEPEGVDAAGFDECLLGCLVGVYFLVAVE